MDKLDKLSLLAIIILAVSASFLVAVYADDTEDQDQSVVRQQVRVFSPELERKVKIAKDLLENNNLLKAEELATGLISEYPYDGAGHMIIGDIQLRTETTYNALRLKEQYDDPLIRDFARHFGRPAFAVTVDKEAKRIVEVTVTRDACCGCAHFAAEKLAGTPIADSLEQVGLNHHHYPCQASMGIDPLYGDTLMHISGNIMKDALREGLGDDFEVPYVRPAGFVEE